MLMRVSLSFKSIEGYQKRCGFLWSWLSTFGRLPTVEIEETVRGSVSNRGSVVTIKNGDGYRGCAVRFWDLGYNTWFHADPNGTDRRCHYMRELTIVKH